MKQSGTSEMSLALGNNCAEDVRVGAVVIAELKLRDVKRKIFGADLVERANNAAFENRPKTLNRIRMDRADNILMPMVVNGSVRIHRRQTAITGPRIRCEQRDLVGNRLRDERKNGVASGSATEHARNDIPLALYGTDNGRLAAVMAFLFVPVAVLVIAANVGFVHLHNAAKLFLRLHHRRADFVAHQMRGVVRAEAQLPLNLKRADAFLAGGHQMDDLEPIAERFVRVFEDGSGDHREPIAVWRAFLALPMPFSGRQVIDGGIAATRTPNTGRPASRFQVRFRSFIVAKRETLLKLAFGHLMDRLRTFCHGGYPLEPQNSTILYGFLPSVKSCAIASRRKSVSGIAC